MPPENLRSLHGSVILDVILRRSRKIRSFTVVSFRKSKAVNITEFKPRIRISPSRTILFMIAGTFALPQRIAFVVSGSSRKDTENFPKVSPDRLFWRDFAENIAKSTQMC